MTASKSSSLFDLRPDPMLARDLVGYGENTPDPLWPGGARIAVNFNLNIEGGGESTLANGDTTSEGMLNDIGVAAKAGRRAPLVESVFEYCNPPAARRPLAIFPKFPLPVRVPALPPPPAPNPPLPHASHTA